MSMHYSDPERESDPHALPDVEVFYVRANEFRNASDGTWMFERMADSTELDLQGFYWWPCFPGCLPDSDPIGPFETEAEALADAQADAEPVCDCKRSNGPYAECECERGES